MHTLLFATGKTLQLLVCLTTEAFNEARAAFGFSHHVGRPMPIELPKSWDYLQHAWNSCARTPVTGAIESVIEGDSNSVTTFSLFVNGKSKKSKTKVRLVLPDDFDKQVCKVAALVDHFNKNYGKPALYGEAVIYQAPKQEHMGTEQFPVFGDVNAGNPSAKVSLLKKYMCQKGVTDVEMISFVLKLSCLVKHTRSLHVLVKQWCSVVKKCWSHWCPPPPW